MSQNLKSKTIEIENMKIKTKFSIGKMIGYDELM